MCRVVLCSLLCVLSCCFLYLCHVVCYQIVPFFKLGFLPNHLTIFFHFLHEGIIQEEKEIERTNLMITGLLGGN